MHILSLKTINNENGANILQAIEIKEELDVVDANDQTETETDEIQLQQVNCILF